MLLLLVMVLLVVLRIHLSGTTAMRAELTCKPAILLCFGRVAGIVVRMVDERGL